MTRPMTKQDFALVAKELVSAPFVCQTRSEVDFQKFLIVTAIRGAAIGILFATLLLATDTLGLLTLIRAQSAPLTVTFVMYLLCGLKAIPLTLATTLAFTAHSR
jgi:hypothetical protein